ncbi:glycosyltransferase family 39 protein [Streptomyces sp. MI02-7b]|uniref:glycosyltransferase family 39 protein n=1 Tax=Streptomyces sp. MI02-7b TaxID=462941 RepID=UPI0029A1AE6B|nr:glycosyltransferase family 39 protein [Streptomyces sp. MI02-7b]MDX3074938.1 glycosyltransferase family 39 protein [Streptomyces sp. MI02-7b]
MKDQETHHHDQYGDWPPADGRHEDTAWQDPASYPRYRPQQYAQQPYEQPYPQPYEQVAAHVVTGTQAHPADGREAGPEAPAVPGYVVPEVPVSAWSIDTRRSTWIGRSLVLCVLLVQAGLSFRLGGRAFAAEAYYLAPGHHRIGHSGVYPVVAKAADAVGGLAAARSLSLLFMLGVTALLYAMTSRMFNERAGLAAAGLFAVVESTELLGSLATADAMALFLIAAAAWALVRTGRSHPSLALLAAPFAALAPATKSVAVLYLPSLVVLAVLSAYPYRGARAFLRGLFFGAGTLLLLGAAAYLSGGLDGLTSATTGRAHGTDPALDVLWRSAEWGGLVLLVAVGGAVDYVRRSRMGEMPWATGDTPGAVRRTALGLLMCGTALLAPVCQAYLNDDVSLFKHVGFGLLFAAPMAGLGISRLVGAHFRYPQLGIMVWVGVLVVGMAQTQTLYRPPDSGQMVNTLRKVVGKDGRYLAEQAEIPAYYLADSTRRDQWHGTRDIDFTDKSGEHHTGPDGFRRAVRAGWFDAIVLNGDVTPGTDKAITDALHGNSGYRLLAVLPSTDAYGSTTYRIWVKR